MGAAALIAVVLLVACGEEAEPPPPPDLVSEVRLLQGAITGDPALQPLEEVDDAVLDDRPVLAAEMLETGAIPAARRQVEALDALELTTDEARGFRRRLARAYGRRVDALQRWRDLLARGTGEDLELVEAMGAVREADEDVLDIDREMQEVRPLPEADEESAAKRARSPRPRAR